MASTMVTRTICERHDFRASVGRNVQFALDYYECPACIREQDAEYAASQVPCCSAANTTCCGHGDDDEGYRSDEDADDALRGSLAFPSRVGYRFSQEGRRFDSLGGLVITSPNFCDFTDVPF